MASVCLLLDFCCLDRLRDWVAAGALEGWLPAGCALYHLAGAPDTFCVREGPPPVPVVAEGVPFGTTVVRTNPTSDPVED